GDRRALFTHEATIVMATKEGYQNVWVGIEIVLRKRFGDLVDTLAFRKTMTNGIEEWEVEQRIETGVVTIKSHAAALEKRSVSHIAVLHFAYDFEVSKLFMQGSIPVAPERVRHILPGIHANPIQSGRADPP